VVSGADITGAQYVRKQIVVRLLVEGQEPSHRQIAPGVVVTVEERQLLDAVRWIIGRVQIDRDPLGFALQAPAMPLDHRVGERDPHPVQIRTIKSVLEPRERGLRGQVLTLERIATTQQLLDGVGAQSAGIVAIRITAGDGIQALAHQIPDRMTDLARLASVIDPTDQCLGQSETPIAGLQQHRATVGTGMVLIKFGHDRLAGQIRKQNTLSCAIVIHAKAFVVMRNACGKEFLS
jgi:hypothetical protein